jgi:MtrB/PioB family decaheme-associated outer membrane protein
MNARKILLIISMMLFPTFPVLAAGGSFEGSLDVTGEWSNQSGDKAKLNEYRDIRKQGLYGGFLFKYDSDAFFLQGQASDIAYDTQHYRIEGGAYGKFNLYMDYNEIPHNFTYDAISFYNGVGSNTLVNKFVGFPTADTSSWTHLNYAIKRQTSEGGFSLNLLKPFYFTASASREERTGTMPTSFGAGSPGGAAVELPQPVDYITDIVRAEIGYARKPVFVSLSGEFSNFNNTDHVLYFTNPSAGVNTPDAMNLPPDNQYYKIALKGSLQLPLNSKLNVNLATSRATSDADLFNYRVSVATTTFFGLSSTLFNGQVDTQNYQVVLTSNPLSFLTAKIYYKYYERQNNSDRIITTDGTPFTNELYTYHRNNYGIDMGFKLPAHFYLKTAYSNLRTNRTRDDLPETRDNLYSTELKWTGLDFMTTKVGYEHLERNADHGVLLLVTGAQATENAIGPFVHRFDGAAQNRDIVKASVDINPMDNLNFNIGYKYKMIDYKDTILGLRRSTAHRANLDASYTIGRFVQLNAYVDYEANRSYQFQRVFTVAGADPFGPTQNATNYNWDVRIQDNSFAYGGRADIFIIPKKLTFIVQYDNVNSNGRDDFTYLAGGLPAARTQDNIDIGAVDDYTLRALVAKVVYKPWNALTMTAGYAYESFTYNDAAWDSYRYVVGTNTFLTGAYANPNYHANVVFVSANYRF